MQNNQPPDLPKYDPDDFDEQLHAAIIKVKSLFAVLPADQKYLYDPSYQKNFHAHELKHLKSQLSNETSFLRTVEKFEQLIRSFPELYSNLFNQELWPANDHLMTNLKHMAKFACDIRDPIESFRLSMTDEITVSWTGSKKVLFLSEDIKSMDKVMSQTGMKR